MVKKTAKPKSRAGAKRSPSPEPSRLRALERLLEEGRFDELVRRADALVGQFPDHGGLRRLHVEALRQSGAAHTAAVAAFRWSERRPNSLPAQQALLELAVVSGNLLLADRVAERVRALGAATPGFPLDAATVEGLSRQMDGSTAARTDMERFEIGRLFFDGFDFAEAVRRLTGLEQLPARNNRALALFHLHRIDESLAAFDGVWRDDPGNLFALGWCVRLRLFNGERERAVEDARALGGALSRRVDDALSQVEALLLLQEDRAAWNAFERASASAWYDTDQSSARAALDHCGACAAARSGRPEKARALWERAEASGHDTEQVIHNLDMLAERGGEVAYPEIFDLHQWLPWVWLDGLKGRPDAMQVSIEGLKASNDYLHALYLGGTRMLRIAAAMVLQSRVEGGDAEAARRLRDLARLPVGSEDERFGLLRFLEDQSLLSRDGPAEIWEGGSVRQVRMIKTEIHRERQDSELPEELDKLLDDAIAAFGEQLYEEAEERLKQVLAASPDHPVVLGNLAAVCDARGRREEARELLRTLVDRHPDYLFGRCNLARTLILTGDLDEAERLLPEVEDYARLHVEDLFALMGSVAMLHGAKGDEAAASAALNVLQSVLETEDDARRFRQISRLVEVARTAGSV